MPLMIPQFLTEAVLRTRLAELGGQDEFGCELIGFAQDDAGVTASLVGPSGEERVAARYFVGADGGRSDIPVQSASWASAYGMNARLADRYRVSRVFLVGDAAHIHPPTGGQGLNTGVQDAHNIGWKLAAVLRGAPDRLFDSYEEERRPVAQDVLGLSTRLLEAQKRGDMRRGREVQQFDTGYPDSSLAFQPSARAGILRAGDRAPDAPLRGAGGCTRRLFDLFVGPHWTLLGFETPGDLVRPDGYVGAIGTAGEIDQLGSYLSSACC